MNQCFHSCIAVGDSGSQSNFSGLSKCTIGLNYRNVDVLDTVLGFVVGRVLTVE